MSIAIMPHREYSGEELDGKHPSLIPPDDEALEDTQHDDDDCVLRHVLGIADRLRQDAASYGRKRRTTNAATTTLNNVGGSRGQPLRQPLRTPKRVDNPGVQTADGFGPVRAPGQLAQHCQSQQHNRSDKPPWSMSPSLPSPQPRRGEQPSRDEVPRLHPGAHPRVHCLRPLSDLIGLQPSSL